MPIFTSERRLKRVWVSEDAVFYLFCLAHQSLPACLALPRFQNYPGSRCVGVHHDPWSRGYWFVLYHPDFEEVLEGLEIPRADEYLGAVEVVALRRDESNSDVAPCFVVED